MEPPEVALGVWRLRPGVVTPGEANPPGVEAYSVANRSGAGEAAGRLQLISKKTKKIVETSSGLLIIPFNVLKKEFFTR
jgi:hypothetical protein